MAVKNKYTIERNYIRKGNARSGAKISKVRFLVAHEVGANSNADANRAYFNNHQPSASAHTFIDANKILEIVPLNEKAWHVQYNKPIDNMMFGADANDAAIGTELCRPGDFNKAYDRYVWYHAYLCKKFGLQPRKHIVAHKTLDPQRRRDPQSWLEPNGVSWGKFINDVQAYYDKWESDSVKNKAAPKAKVKSVASTKTNSSKSKANIAVDGYWGKDTTRALQRYFGTVADGEIWGQYKTATTKQITSGMVYGPPYNGSPVIKELQKKVGGKRDGLLGPDTVKRLQKYLKTPVDGEIWHPSTVIKEMQRRLNAGTF